MCVRGEARFGVPARVLAAVCPVPSFTRVPGVPPAILGLIGWKGRVLPLLELGAVGSAPPPAAVIVESVGGALALAADSVEGWDLSPLPPLVEPDALYHSLRASLAPSLPPPPRRSR